MFPHICTEQTHSQFPPHILTDNSRGERGKSQPVLYLALAAPLLYLAKAKRPINAHEVTLRRTLSALGLSYHVSEKSSLYLLAIKADMSPYSLCTLFIMNISSFDLENKAITQLENSEWLSLMFPKKHIPRQKLLCTWCRSINREV